MDTVEELAEENLPNSLGASRHNTKLGIVTVAEEDEDNYRDSLFGQNKESA